METKAPPLPPVNISRVLATRDKLFDALAHFCDGASYTGRDFEHLVFEAACTLPASIDHRALFTSLSPLAGRPIDRKEFYTLCWSIAGQMDRLQAGLPVCDWRSAPGPFWAPLQVLERAPALTRDGKPTNRYTFRFLAGPPCTLSASTLWPTGLVHGVLSPLLGFTPPWKDRPFHHPADIVGLRFVVLVDGDLNGEYDGPPFEKFDCTPGLRSFNRDVLALRKRAGVECPEGFTLAEMPCHLCPIGYDECLAGTHPATFFPRRCGVCGKETMHDPNRRGACTECP